MKRIIWQIWITFFIITFLSANSYSAALKIVPATTTITSNQPVTVNINVEDAADLYGAGEDSGVIP